MQAISLWLAAAIVILTGWAIVKKYLKSKRTQRNTQPLQKYCALLSCVTAQALPEAAEKIVLRALKEKVSPLEIREIVYQCAPYVGIGRVQETMEGVNDAFKKAHIPLPLPTATTVTDKNRREAGEQMVMKLNGDRMKQILSQVAKDEYDLRVNDLYDFCFGDFYTRSGLSLKDRELVVFGAIAALGGCEAQLRSHIGANLREGTTKAQLVDALRVMLPSWDSREP
ncbi:carboxymuconolactone decarboxylase family protein [Parasutterella sp.]|uniref:carboxymuconolactone decarboxylase family protein n=2 Tax=Parasutterella sp. TaxID=2049037 RepID=UPI003AF171B3